ncbi:MAG: hypothetical protein JO225_09495 [Candidatus Eremiobacteraeota bacterium]|nr:hypothetical protein [Candidatus Eremiobacteraeota bacterium]MBV8644133.1 hypothetical protein [Candidatus Eremiobacteraeota bacterium]
MRTLLLAAGLAAFPLAVSLAGPAAEAKVGASWVEGTLVHVSSANIKVKDDKTGQELSFLLVPHFDQVFSGDGKTTYQMKSLHSGQLVKVFYDQRALGMRHADRILVLNRSEMQVKQQKG